MHHKLKKYEEVVKNFNLTNVAVATIMDKDKYEKGKIYDLNELFQCNFGPVKILEIEALNIHMNYYVLYVEPQDMNRAAVAYAQKIVDETTQHYTAHLIEELDAYRFQYFPQVINDYFFSELNNYQQELVDKLLKQLATITNPVNFSGALFNRKEIPPLDQDGELTTAFNFYKPT